MNELKIPSFAKVNLLLRVLGRREDGYHTIQTVLQTIDLHDELTFFFTPAPDLKIDLEASGDDLPLNEQNLIYQACTLFHEAYPIRSHVRVRIEKKIPLESGLGGGSSNAASALIALSRLFNWPLGLKDLSILGRRIGADVPFFLYGGTALGTERGDVITPLEDWPGFPILLVHPEIRCSTAGVYQAYDESGLLTVARDSIKIHLDQRPESLRDLIFQMENDLEKVVFSLYPELDSIKKRLFDAGAAAAALTGSGSCVFGLFEDAVGLERAAREFPAATPSRFLARAEYCSRLGL